MARLNVRSAPVQTVINEHIVPLFLAHGTIAGLTKALNDALAHAKEPGTLHPNRLHALLSDDVSRGINDSTLALTEKAAQLAIQHDPQLLDRAASQFDALQEKANRLFLFAGITAEELADRLGAPLAIARKLLAGDSTHSPALEVAEAPTTSATDTMIAPDWSYQDTAVSRCMDAFRRRPNGRIGLVLPTGAGKTRTALRIVLAMLDKAKNPKAVAYWVTHRRNLREQAHRELQKLLSSDIDPLAADHQVVLANRIKFTMVGEIATLLKTDSVPPALIVIDEAHHAAAPSYQPAFSSPATCPALLLTATPNRGDRLPIGIDEIAFTITYRELAKRRAVLTPKFLDLPVKDFAWEPEAVDDLADYVIDRAMSEFTKVLVLAPRLDRVKEFFDALLNRLPANHPIEPDDIGYVHGNGNSLGIDNEDFLARFTSKPRAILVSAQLLLEGFDDPAINTVVLTYPSSSVIRLMQAAGRCVRFAPDKRAAYVVQARNDNIAYHFEQRWLYQEIDDFLRPQLLDIDYRNADELKNQVDGILQTHNVDRSIANNILNRLETGIAGETCRLFLYGLPYFGQQETFNEGARWGAIIETPETSAVIRSIFNNFCALGAELSDPSDFLARDGAVHGVLRDHSPGSAWMELMGLLTASYFAKCEVHGPTPLETSGSRPYRRAGATTWLKYLTFNFRPAIPAALSSFLHDCHNAASIETRYLERPHGYRAAAKVPLPLSGSEAFLLTAETYDELDEAIVALRSRLSQVDPPQQFGELGAFIASSDYLGLPNRLLSRTEFLLAPLDRSTRILHLNDTTTLANGEIHHG